jgi:hypothetical protein
LRALFVTLSLDFFGEFVDRNQIALVQLDRSAQRFDCFSRVTATALQES